MVFKSNCIYQYTIFIKLTVMILYNYFNKVIRETFLYKQINVKSIFHSIWVCKSRHL